MPAIDIASHYGRVKNRLRESGKSIPENDINERYGVWPVERMLVVFIAWYD